MKNLFKVLILSHFKSYIFFLIFINLCFNSNQLIDYYKPGRFIYDTINPNGSKIENLKKLTLTKFIYKQEFGNYEEILDTTKNNKSVQITNYNSDGNKIDVIPFSYDNKPNSTYKQTYTYNSENKIKRIDDYNTSGELIDSYYDKNFPEPSTTVFKYDSNNILIKSVGYDHKGQICNKCYGNTVVYKNDGTNIIEEKYYTHPEYDLTFNVDDDWSFDDFDDLDSLEFSFGYTYLYDDNNNLIQRINDRDYITKFEYDLNNQLIQITDLYPNIKPHDIHKTVISYNPNNKLIESKVKYMFNDSLYIYKQEEFNFPITKYIYDNHNNLIKTLFYDEKMKLITFDECKYDNFRNDVIETIQYDCEEKFGEIQNIPKKKYVRSYEYLYNECLIKEWGVPFRYTIENLGEGEYVPVSLQQWMIVNLENDGNYKIYVGSQGTDFEWDENYQILPTEDEFWDLIDSESLNYNDSYLKELKNWKLLQIYSDDRIHFCF